LITSLYSGAAGMLIELSRTNIIANNLANISTPGFKKEVAVFRSYPEPEKFRLENEKAEIPAPIRTLGFELGKVAQGISGFTYTDFSNGPLNHTERELDLAINGTGLFAVLTKDGVKFTRNGSFHKTPDGEIVTLEGYKLLGEAAFQLTTAEGPIFDENGALPPQVVPIKVNPSQKIFIDENGVVYQNNRTLFKILLGKWKKGKFKKVGDNLWISSKDIKSSVDSKILQYTLEGANVSAVKEMVNLIEANRTYEANQRVITTSDQTIGQLFSRVLRT